MFASRGFFGAGVIKPNLTDRQVWDINAGTDEADAYVSFGTTGSLVWFTHGSGSHVIDREWMTSVITSSEAALYELIATKLSGTLTYGATGTYQLGVASRKFGCYMDINDGIQEATVQFQIRKIGTATVLAQCEIDFRAESSNA